MSVLIAKVVVGVVLCVLLNKSHVNYLLSANEIVGENTFYLILANTIQC